MVAREWQVLRPPFFCKPAFICDCGAYLLPAPVAVPKGGQLLICDTYAHVAGLVGPDTAGTGAAALGPSPPPTTMFSLQICAVVGLEPRTVA